MKTKGLQNAKVHKNNSSFKLRRYPRQHKAGAVGPTGGRGERSVFGDHQDRDSSYALQHQPAPPENPQRMHCTASTICSQIRPLNDQQAPENHRGIQTPHNQPKEHYAPH